MTISLHWFRRRQRHIARTVLAVFAVAWLQFAVLPCTMALAAASIGAAASVPVSVPGPGGADAADAGHDAPVPPCHEAGLEPVVDCPYCLGHGAVGGDGAACSYPQGAQASLSTVVFSLAVGPPVALHTLAVPTRVDRPLRARSCARLAGGTPLNRAYCRYLE